jgi:hypothetical protein
MNKITIEKPSSQREHAYDVEDCMRDCKERLTIYEETPYPPCESICGNEAAEKSD